MTAQTTLDTSTAPKALPKASLCFLQYEGYHLKHAGQYRHLVTEPSAICDRCGRTARNSRNLCNPSDLT